MDDTGEPDCPKTAVCDEDIRTPLPALEGDVLAYIGYLSIEGRISPESLPQYISAVSQYHERQLLPSPTKTPLVRAFVKAYRRHFNASADTVNIRVGCSAPVVRSILRVGFSGTSAYDIGACKAAVFAFIFTVRQVSAMSIALGNVCLTPEGIEAVFHHRKGRSVRRPLVMRYGMAPSWKDEYHSVTIVRKWTATRPGGEYLFNVVPPNSTNAVYLTICLEHALALANVRPPSGALYTSHSLRIGGYNELSCLRAPKEWLMRRLDWGSEAMLRVYHDSNVVATDDSNFFFAHIVP